MSTHSNDSTDEGDDVPTTEQLAERLDELEAENERLREAIEEEADDAEEATDGISTTRRGALGGLAALAGVGALTGKSRAQTAAPGSACTWRGDQNAAGYNLLGLGAIGGGLTNDNTVENLAGTDLAIDSDGNLNVDAEAGGQAGLWTEEQDGDVTTAGGQGVDVPAVTTGNASTDAQTASFVVYERGGTIFADAQQQGLTSQSGGDFATVLQAAVDNLPDDGGKINIREGSYTVSSTITWSDPKQQVIIEGEGMGRGDDGNLEGPIVAGTRLEADGAHRIFDINIGSGGNASKITFELHDMALIGTGSQNGVECIRMENQDQTLIERCFISKWQEGLRAIGSSNAYNVVRAIFITNDRHVVHKDGAKPQFYQTRFLESDGDGMTLEAGGGKGHAVGCDFHALGGKGAVLNGHPDFDFIGCIWDFGITDTAVEINSAYCSLGPGCIVQDNDSAGVVANGPGIVVDGHILNNGGVGVDLQSNDVTVKATIEDNSGAGIKQTGTGGGAEIVGARLRNNGSGTGEHGVILTENSCLVSATYFFGNSGGSVEIAGGNGTVLKGNQYNGTAPTDNGSKTVIEGVGKGSLGGSPPSASNWPVGTIVEDSDNSGDAYLVGRVSVTQIGT